MAHPFYLPQQLFRETTLFHQVEILVNDFADLWRLCSPKAFPLETTFSARQQHRREQHLTEFIEKLEAEKKRPDARYDDIDMQERMFAHVRAFFKGALGFGERELDLVLSLGFKESTKTFVHQARQFDASLAPADVFQACRNVWIMNGLQLMLGREVKFTPAIFAYSMLYPYTDNYLDDPTISRQEKVSFNNRFARRLAGEVVSPMNAHEHIIFALVEMIEGDFARALFPNVYASLLAIHQAQTKSVLLLGAESMSAEDVLKISLEKGGASVLADGYLVAGELTPQQAWFMFGYGAYLQLLDDLQDVREDGLAGQRSIYTLAASNGTLDKMMGRTLDFGERVLKNQRGFAGASVGSYNGLMRTSIRLMLLEAAGLAPDYFSPDYLKKLEKRSPFRFSCLAAMKKRHQPYSNSMFGKLM